MILAAYTTSNDSGLTRSNKNNAMGANQRKPDSATKRPLLTRDMRKSRAIRAKHRSDDSVKRFRGPVIAATTQVAIKKAIMASLTSLKASGPS
jgi:hypothetical protein